MDDTREFKINLHADEPEDVIDSSKALDGPKKVSAKASVLFVVLAFITLGGLLGFLYYNLNSKIQTINTRGSAGIANLSTELNDKLASFSQQFTDQQETTRALVAALDAQLKKVSSSLSDIQTAKLDKKDLDIAVKGVQNALEPLQASIASFTEQLPVIQKETEQITVNIKKLQTGVLNNKKEISTLDAIHIDREYFDQELKKEREFNQQNMAHASEALFSEIAALHQRLNDLETEMHKKTQPPAIKKNIPGSTPSQTKIPSENLSVPKPGEIIEQEIE